VTGGRSSLEKGRTGTDSCPYASPFGEIGARPSFGVACRSVRCQLVRQGRHRGLALGAADARTRQRMLATTDPLMHRHERGLRRVRSRYRANATLGRALRLWLINVGGSRRARRRCHIRPSGRHTSDGSRGWSMAGLWNGKPARSIRAQCSSSVPNTRARSRSTAGPPWTSRNIRIRRVPSCCRTRHTATGHEPPVRKKVARDPVIRNCRNGLTCAVVLCESCARFGLRRTSVNIVTEHDAARDPVRAAFFLARQSRRATPPPRWEHAGGRPRRERSEVWHKDR
jgi:hypothetical protein